MRRSSGVRDHSYEEVRDAMNAILAGRETPQFMREISQHSNLEVAVAEVLCRRDDPDVDIREKFGGNYPHLSRSDSELCSEAFWNAFREGIITLGYDSSNKQYPFFRVSQFGKRILENNQVYFFHDVSSYEALITSQVPNIDPITLLYAKEAMQAFRSGCILSASVMIGVAAEHTFDLLLDTIAANPAHATTYAAVQKERNALTRMTKMWRILEPKLSTLPYDVREDLELQFIGIQKARSNLKRNWRGD